MSAKSKFNGGRGRFQSSGEVFMRPGELAPTRSENHGIPQRCEVIHLPHANGETLPTYEVAGERRLAAGLWLPLSREHLAEKLAFVVLNVAAVAAIGLAGYNATRPAVIPTA